MSPPAAGAAAALSSGAAAVSAGLSAGLAAVSAGFLSAAGAAEPASLSLLQASAPKTRPSAMTQPRSLFIAGLLVVSSRRWKLAGRPPQDKAAGQTNTKNYKVGAGRA